MHGKYLFRMEDMEKVEAREVVKRDNTSRYASFIAMTACGSLPNGNCQGVLPDNDVRFLIPAVQRTLSQYVNRDSFGLLKTGRSRRRGLYQRNK